MELLIPGKHGFQRKLARMLGVSDQAVSSWIKTGRIPAGRVLAVERATGGRWTRESIRPDIYPPADGARTQCSYNNKTLQETPCIPNSN